jgi:hypothetical protein
VQSSAAGGTLAAAKWATATAFPASRAHLAPLFVRPALTPRVAWGSAKPRPLAGSNPSDAASLGTPLARSGDTRGVYGHQALSVASAFGACALIPRPKGRGTSRFSVEPLTPGSLCHPATGRARSFERNPGLQDCASVVWWQTARAGHGDGGYRHRNSLTSPGKFFK